MKGKYVCWIVTGLLILFTTVSCRTRPDYNAALETLEEAAARAAAARQLALDFDGPVLFPSEWDAADSLYAYAEEQRTTEPYVEIRQSAERYTIAAEALEALAARAIAQSFENMERDLVSARAAAVNAGAPARSPDFLLQADNAVYSARELYEAGDFHAARDASVNALAMYGAIETGLRALSVREQVQEIAEAVVPGLFSQADTVARDALARWDAGDFPGARAGAAMALVLYSRTGATAERQRALDIRANVAARQEFDSAQSLYTRADTAYRAQSMDEAGALFVQSAPLFGAAARLAYERQLIAEEALRLANERMAESDEIAREAERILEGGGI
ncbi:MAG: hypothetical protein FWC64_03215 [Treponema sp.]|nr:hypothetical protein [Treponema sp.]